MQINWYLKAYFALIKYEVIKVHYLPKNIFYTDTNADR